MELLNYGILADVLLADLGVNVTEVIGLPV